jgi:hypothetical protein
MIKNTHFLLFALILLISNCKKEENKSFILKGQVTDARSGSAMGNVQIIAEQQLLEGGSFGGFYSEAAKGNTTSNGDFLLEWDNANIVEARVTGSFEGYITRVYNLNASSFQPGEEVTQNLSLFPEANIKVRLLKSGVVSNATQINYRFENADFDCLCCNNNWRNITANYTDTTFTCRVYGDTWLRYRYEILQPGETVFMRDSIFCTRNSLSNLTVEW